MFPLQFQHLTQELLAATMNAKCINLVHGQQKVITFIVEKEINLSWQMATLLPKLYTSRELKQRSLL